MVLLVWGGLPPPDIVIGAEVFLCIIEAVFGGQVSSVSQVNEFYLSDLRLLQSFGSHLSFQNIHYLRYAGYLWENN